jgi:hypothetical protein
MMVKNGNSCVVAPPVNNSSVNKRGELRTTLGRHAKLPTCRYSEIGMCSAQEAGSVTENAVASGESFSIGPVLQILSALVAHQATRGLGKLATKSLGLADAGSAYR